MQSYYQPRFSTLETERGKPVEASDGQENKLRQEDRAFHDWYRFVLSYPPHLVRAYLRDFGLGSGCRVLDPFCGTGTTLVEAKLQGLDSVGLEPNPFPHFASTVKTRWDVDPDLLAAYARQVAAATREELEDQGIDDLRPFTGDIGDLALETLPPPAAKLLIKNSISPLPLHKVCVLLRRLRDHLQGPLYDCALLALGSALVNQIGNLRFGPEVGIGAIKPDVPVVPVWLANVDQMCADLRLVQGRDQPACRVHLADSREVGRILDPTSIDAVITSPPYPNEKDYSRTTRLESVVLGFINNLQELRASKKALVRSNTRGVYKEDDDDRWVSEHEEIQRIADAIEERRIALGKTSGFEKTYARVTRLYFGGMARHLADLRTVLRPGAWLAYVVGDQASYLRVMIRTGQLLAEIAQALGYDLERIDLFRTRFATATKKEMREEVVVLRWPG